MKTKNIKTNSTSDLRSWGRELSVLGGYAISPLGLVNGNYNCRVFGK